MSESRMTSDDYGEGYWERGEGSNYVKYGDDPGWATTVACMMKFHTPETEKIVEVAAAKGYFLKAAQRAGFIVEGVDISEHAVASADPEIRESLHLGNAVNLPWSDQWADAVCSWEFLEHVYEDELDRVLSEMERVLAGHGWMWHRIGVLESEGDRSNHMHDGTHVTNKPSTWWRGMFDSRGLIRKEAAEQALDHLFASRDWSRRFFVYGRD